MDGYRVLVASDVPNDAIALELYDPSDELIMDVYEVNDDPTSRECRLWRDTSVPVAVVVWFLSEAATRLRLRDPN